MDPPNQELNRPRPISLALKRREESGRKMIEAETILSLLFFLHRTLPTSGVQNSGEKRSTFTVKFKIMSKRLCESPLFS